MPEFRLSKLLKMTLCRDRNIQKNITDTYLAAIDNWTQCSREITCVHFIRSLKAVYLFEQRVSADFLHPDLTEVKLFHILIQDRLQVHGTIETALQFPEQRR